MSADELRVRFKALDRDKRHANDHYCIRVWRGLSWLSRAEQMPNADLEGRFISTWIAFNALYGRLDPQRRPWGDRESMGTYLAQVWRLDRTAVLDRLISKRQLHIFRLVEDKYLSHRFWEEGNSAAKRIRKELTEAMSWPGTSNAFRILQLLFDRLYVMRNQVLHGACTKDSKLNRRPLREAGNLLIELVHAMLDVMIAHGVEEDWGEVCYPPEGPKSI